MAITIITPAPIEPVTIDEIKAHCRVDAATDDDLLAGLCIAARLQAEHITQRIMVSTTCAMVLSAFPAGFSTRDQKVSIPKPPLQSVTSVKYYNANNVQQTLSPSIYAVNTTAEPGSIYPVYGQCWPDTYVRHDAVTIQFVCGYPTQTVSGEVLSTTPEGIRRWMLLYLAALYENREALSQGNTSPINRDYVNGLLDQYRVYI